ncbi:MAG: hypothetical protein JWQ76_3077 [Ramlibacter sp.]|nr:hypothetical protein [Ramlibacter sp.]
MTQLKLIQSLDTTGARAAESFVHDGQRYLVVPQLAADVEGQPALMTMGNSDIAAPVYKWRDDRFWPWRTLPVAGGEDAEFFRIGDRAFMATASLRTGANPYDLNSHSTIFELERGEFVPFQSIPTFAAKQWKHFSIAGREFLALAQGVTLQGNEPRHSPVSAIFEWTGTRFEEFQRVRSAWGYNWLFFELAGESFLAYADHVESSRILRWTGKEFEEFQQLDGKSGRAFCFFEHGGADWLVFACLHDETTLYAWNGERFARRQAVSGPGGRELRWLPAHERLVLVNFVHGTREQPVPSLQSALYRFEGGRLVIDEEFATLGGTDATAFEEGGETFLVVSHALGADIRFRTESKVYRVG